MKLSELLTDLPITFSQDSDPEICGIASDSRKIQPGFLFIAETGLTVDGHQYARKAMELGAVALLVEHQLDMPITQAITLNTSALIGLIAARFYQRPSDKMRMIGITGTKGKTTTSFLIHYLLSTAEKKIGLMGSVRFQVGSFIEESQYTTQPAIPLQEKLYTALQMNATAMIMEVSSHALAQRRVANIDFDVAVFTNFSHDHLDFHRTMEEYLQAKSLLFSHLGNYDLTAKGKKFAVINGDDPTSFFIRSQCGVPVFSFGLNEDNLIRASRVELFPHESHFILCCPEGEFKVRLPLPGRFNVYNFLAAFTVAWLEKVPVAEIVTRIQQFPGVPGRFQQVQSGQSYQVIIDYAHTEDSLRQALITAREFTTGKLRLVFGCTGDRDRSKRPIMGLLASQLADDVIVTSDDPHSEEPLLIIEEIRSGVPQDAAHVHYQVDRRTAIEIILSRSQAGDTVLLAGKGHEQVQIFRDFSIPFSDAQIAKETIEKLKDRKDEEK
jgi:UDP-N-acetylmuramoyl-L-alanyl-D-glutamate--2,6-diaminopimelate ligase